jgi:hypothetical protein
MKDDDFAQVGEVTKTEHLVVTGLDGTTAIDLATNELKAAWQQPLGV